MLIKQGGETYVMYALGDSLDQITWEIINLVMENNGDKVSCAARTLGLNRTTLAEKLKARKKKLAAQHG